MKILFDEPVPWDLAGHFPDGFQVSMAQRMGWQSRANGELLRLAHQEGFEAIITMDKQMQHQQNPDTLPMPVIVLSAPQPHDRKQLGKLVSTEVVPLLQQGAENRFYLFGPTAAQRQEAPPPDDFIREPLAVGYR